MTTGQMRPVPDSVGTTPHGVAIDFGVRSWEPWFTTNTELPDSARVRGLKDDLDVGH